MLFSINPLPGKAGGELLDDLFDLIVVQPRIDDCKPLSQHRQHDNFGKTLPKRIAGLLLRVGQVDDFPAQAVQLLKQGFLYVVAFVQKITVTHGDFASRRTRKPSASATAPCRVSSVANERLPGWGET